MSGQSLIYALLRSVEQHCLAVAILINLTPHYNYYNITHPIRNVSITWDLGLAGICPTELLPKSSMLSIRLLNRPTAHAKEPTYSRKCRIPPWESLLLELCLAELGNTALVLYTSFHQHSAKQGTVMSVWARTLGGTVRKTTDFRTSSEKHYKCRTS